MVKSSKKDAMAVFGIRLRERNPLKSGGKGVKISDYSCLSPSTQFLDYALFGNEKFSVVSYFVIYFVWRQQPFVIVIVFAGSSPEPFTFDLLSIDPFPIIVKNGALVTIAAQVTLNKVMEVGTKVALSFVLEGFIPIKIPCLVPNSN